MLGSVVYQVLAGYLGYYVKDMQREQFRIGLWSGTHFFYPHSLLAEARVLTTWLSSEGAELTS